MTANNKPEIAPLGEADLEVAHALIHASLALEGAFQLLAEQHPDDLLIQAVLEEELLTLLTVGTIALHDRLSGTVRAEAGR